MSGWFAAHRSLYPPDWDAIARRTKEATGWRCEGCGAPHGPPPHVLTVDHFNRNPGDCTAANLMALCQRCHLRRQGLNPPARTREEALRRLQERAVAELTQTMLW